MCFTGLHFIANFHSNTVNLPANKHQPGNQNGLDRIFHPFGLSSPALTQQTILRAIRPAICTAPDHAAVFCTNYDFIAFIVERCFIQIGGKKFAFMIINRFNFSRIGNTVDMNIKNIHKNTYFFEFPGNDSICVSVFSTLITLPSAGQITTFSSSTK